MRLNGIEIEWLGHASFKITTPDKKLIFVDPFKLKTKDKADFILVTHSHYDHCSPKDIDALMKKETIIIACEDAASKIKGDVRIMAAGDYIADYKSFKVRAVPAYNIDKPYHPKDIGNGYVIIIAGKKIYHAGDTDKIPEMKTVEGVDVALLPVGGTYTMTAKEAAEACNTMIKPKIAVPMHYGTIVGKKSDAEEFKKLCNCKVEIL